MDNTEKYIKRETKAATFYKTEVETYQYYNKLCIAAPSKDSFLKRMRFIYNLKSKTKASQWILENVIPQTDRTIIFCGSKKKATELCDAHFFSRPTKPKPILGNVTPFKQKLYDEKVAEYQFLLGLWQKDSSYRLFVNKEINRLACCDALNEGENIPDLDWGLLDQLNSNEKDLWQRIGRTIRFRPNHSAKIIIVCAEETEDVKWVNSATANLSGANITWIKFADLVSGVETIKYN
jgi:superfamily II DNA/RNA helicase